MSLVVFNWSTCVLTRFSAALQTNQRVHASPFGGSEQVVDMLNDRWQFSMELAPRNHAEAAQVEAFVASLRGSVNTTALHHFARPVPNGTLASSQGLLFDAAQGANSITIATTPGATLLAGDLLGVDGLLVQCRENCVADANGVLVVPLVNRLRRAIAGLRRASTATYLDGAGVLQTAAVDVPRFQGGALLVEGTATNLCARSQEFEEWVNNGLSISVNGETAPDGSVTADVSTGIGTRFFPIFSIPLGLYSFSVFVKPPDATLPIRLYRDGTGQPAAFGSITPSTGVWIIEDGAGVSMGRQVYGDGWFRIWIVFSKATPNEENVHIYPLNAAAHAWWGAQVEAGGAVTSYIPTTTAAATRAADIITPVIWDRPTAEFRLASVPRVQYVSAYSEALALDFAEVVS